MQVANDVASAKELPSCEARPDRRVNNSAEILFKVLDAEPVVQALGLEQRILASPRGRSLDHQSGRKAGNVRLRPHGGLLQEPCLPESCRAASSARIASRALWSAVSLAESAAFVAYEASSAASALEAWSAVMPASRLASCAATKASICYLGVYLQWKSVHRGEQGGQRAGVRLAKEGRVQGRRGDCV